MHNDNEGSVMRGLAWYSGCVLAFSFIAMFVDAVTATDAYTVSSSIWGIALYVPVMVLVILYLKKGGQDGKKE